ncbi:MAG: sulfate ABC transporter permease subunit CysT [Candidatus Margulisiibacteriota bacterium]
MRASKNRLPGFGLSMGITLTLLSLVVLIPLSTLVFKTATLSWDQLSATLFSERTIAAYRLTFTTAAIAALVNTVFGFLVAWVLARYSFWGKRVVDALVDLPFALPTAVAGIAMTALYTPTGALGFWLNKLGIQAAFAPLGIVIVLTFIGLPFVVRTVEPVLKDLEHDIEEAAASLGANRWQTFTRVLFPLVFPSLLTGFTLAFARGLGEYGSVIFISGNMPYKTEIATLLIMTKLEQYDYAGATALAVFMLTVSFLLLLAINGIQHWARKRTGASL